MNVIYTKLSELQVVGYLIFAYNKIRFNVKKRKTKSGRELVETNTPTFNF